MERSNRYVKDIPSFYFTRFGTFFSLTPSSRSPKRLHTLPCIISGLEDHPFLPLDVTIPRATTQTARISIAAFHLSFILFAPADKALCNASDETITMAFFFR